MSAVRGCRWTAVTLSLAGLLLPVHPLSAVTTADGKRQEGRNDGFPRPSEARSLLSTGSEGHRTRATDPCDAHPLIGRPRPALW